MGLFMVAAVLVVQLFAIIFPSQPSLATSANDIIYGAKSKDQVMQAYINNRDTLGRNDIRAIYDHYGIGTAQISAAKPERIGSEQHSFTSTGRSTSPGIDTFVSIPKVSNGGIYQRPLTNWDSINHQQNWYDTITGVSRFGFRFWIIIDGCGNIVFEQNSLPSNLEIVKDLSSAVTANPGDKVSYLIQFRNTGPGIAADVVIKDIVPKELTYQSYASNTNLKFSRNGQELTWTMATSSSQLPPSQKWFTINLNLIVNNTNVSKQACNLASINTKGTTKKDSNQECIKIVIPSINCQNLKIVESPTWNSRKFETQISAQNGGTAKQINYFINNKQASSLPVASGAASQFFTYTFPGEGTYTIRADLEASQGVGLSGRDCELSETIKKPVNPVARLSTDKAVTNLTQNIQDANDTTAKPSDKLKYTIFIKNTGDADATNVELNGEYGESINDILEYSDLIDKGDAQFDNQTKFLSWGAINIPAGGQVQKSFTVQIKDPLPATPASASDPLSYDFDMQNAYGRVVVIHLDKPATKIIEQTAQTLPNTGLGSNIVISAIAFTVIGYFFYRSRLMSKELIIIKDEFASGSL
jgi:uncharacterized repeat protein (TIGR01451 family)